MIKIRSFLILSLSGLLFLVINACKSAKNKENTKTTDSRTASTAPLIESAWDTTATQKKCFTNKGLTHDVVITMEQSENVVKGTVESKDLETNQSSSGNFSGSIEGKNIIIKFESTPPIIGKASEWSDKSWRFADNETKNSAKDMLHIPFKAKNYETNKWEVSDYIFSPVDCRN